jgi:VWFA-related protein
VRYSSIRAFVATGVLTAGLAVFATAQAPQQPPAPEKPQDPAQQQPPPKFRVESNFVRVDAYPLKDGKPVFDLKAEEFEVFEDGKLQKIETFEHVVVRPAGPQGERAEVNSQRESLQAAANPRNRVFIIFLDTPHVMVDSAHRINEPLIRLMDRILGPDDLVGVMTPAMAASQIVLGRKTQVVEDSLRRNWPWGTRFSILKDDREYAYEACYGMDSTLAKELIARKRERATLEALEDLVRYLRSVREERKAILTVTEGWLLYRDNPSLMEPRGPGDVPSVDPVGVDFNGKLTTKNPRNVADGALTKSECDSDRLRLAAMDNKRFFLDLMEDANYANASFYPVDPRGLPVFDNPIGPDPPPPPVVDGAMLKQRIEVMRTLAGNTDGIAVVNNNDLDLGMKRISDDLTSYYLLGYYSSNAKLDGRFRSLKVRVKTPGVEVRARRGYRAATEAEVTAARRAADAPVPEATRAVTAAIDRLGRARPDARFRINAIASGGAKPTVWVAGELQSAAGRPDDFALGGTVNIDVTVGTNSASTRVTLKPGERTFLTSMPAPAGTGEIGIRARLAAADGAAIPLSDMLRVETGRSAVQPLLFRRGVTTGNRVLPAADLRFSRTERVRLELPVEADAKPGAGRVLDRAGQPLQVPVTVGERLDEATGQRWITADVVLAPLAGGDYGIEVEVVGASNSQRIISAIRVVR